MILTHGANSIKRGPKGFMYLTYFNDVDSLNRIDTPVLGNPTEYVPSLHDASTHTLDTQSIKTFNYSGLFETSSQAFSFGHLTDVNDDAVTLEMLYLRKEGYGDAGFISDNNAASNSNDGVGIGYTDEGNIIWCNKDYSYTLYNGCYYIDVGQRKRFALPITLNGSIHHFAFVYSFVDNTISVYVDGVRYATFTKSGALSRNIWSIISSTKNIVITQLCVRKGDCSIEGGASYPVPTTPYYEIPLETVEIGGRKYPTVKIGNQLWMAENLDYKFDVNGSQIPIGQSGTPSTPAAWYYNNNETDYGIDGTYKCGLLYNWYAAKYLDDNKDTLLPNGWHVPTDDEWTALANAVGGTSTAGTKLKASGVSWATSWGGTDDYGFGVLPAGIYYNGSFYDIGSRAHFWTVTESGSEAYYRFFNTDATTLSYTTYKYCGLSVRLVKDAT
jgi:uncharacterized protein (TIGR02145 family)